MDGQSQAYLTKNGIINQFTCIDTLAQNGVAKRKNHHRLEVARALMYSMRLPNSYWGMLYSL